MRRPVLSSVCPVAATFRHEAFFYRTDAEYVDAHATAPSLRGIGEPIWPARTMIELAECHRHEALLNLAFADAPMWLVCPYDETRLAPEVVAAALRTHPLCRLVSGHHPSHDYCDAADAAPPPVLTVPPADAVGISFGPAEFSALRPFIREYARAAGSTDDSVHVLALVADELAANSIRHGGGQGVLRVWQRDDTFVCEAVDRGHITDPLAGRVVPPPDRPNGRGLLLVNQLCDLVQIDSSEHGTTVRAHLQR